MPVLFYSILLFTSNGNTRQGALWTSERMCDYRFTAALEHSSRTLSLVQCEMS